MDSAAIECYMLIGSHEPIVEWLKESGITTKKAAAQMLRGAAQSNVIGSIVHGSDGITSTSHTINRVLKEFKD